MSDDPVEEMSITLDSRDLRTCKTLEEMLAVSQAWTALKKAAQARGYQVYEDYHPATMCRILRFRRLKRTPATPIGGGAGGALAIRP